MNWEFTQGIELIAARAPPMASAASSLYAQTMTNRQKIQDLRRDVTVDYAFGVAGLLVVADAVDELTARVAALEEGADGRRDAHLDRVVSQGEIVSALDDLGRIVEKLAKSIKKSRRR